MSYTVHQLAELAGVSVRTLHYYDQVGLLKPAGVKKNGYRYYDEPELLKLQQILFFRELDFSLEDIREILSSPSFDMKEALRDQRKAIEIRKKRLTGLMQTIDKTLNKLNKKIIMEDEELYGNFSKEEAEAYAKEARERWGNTDAYKQSRERVKKMGKEGMKKVLEESGKLTLEIVECMKAGEPATGERAQKLIARHYDGLRAFYEPNLEMYTGLAEMYVADERFKKNYEKVAEGLAEYMREGMVCFAERGKEK
ncbi:MAG: MerR family transcriptional regulator [Candidatus Paceibacterota bacterium]|jgi:DNA-binding transcriptional MerR regulator|nr:MerR family transcriptional regulator [Candidatus Paceibacterota bacterium]